jgi:hypothetical protein
MGTFCQFVIYVGNIIDRTVSMISECSIKQDLDKSLYFGIRFQNTVREKSVCCEGMLINSI